MFKLVIAIVVNCCISSYKIQGNFYEHKTLELQERSIYRKKWCSVDAAIHEFGSEVEPANQTKL